jgi:hypothetical protein
MTVQSPPGAPPPGPQKKGLGPLAWVAIGCGAIIVIVCIVFAAAGYFLKTRVVDPLKKNPTMAVAKAIVAANPDLDLVSSDDEAGTLTVHNKKTNETVTINANDAKNGNFKITSDGKTSASMSFGKDGITVKAQDANGQVSTFTAGGNSGNLPAWLPAYPGATIKGGFSSNSGTQSAQSLTLTTSDSPDKVLAFYQDRLKSNGLTVQPVTTMAAGGQTSTGLVSAASPDKTRQAQIIVTQASGVTTAAITYEEKH